MTDPFGRALLDHHRGQQDSQLHQRDGGEKRVHPVAEFYFDRFESRVSPDWTVIAVDRPRDAYYYSASLRTEIQDDRR